MVSGAPDVVRYVNVVIDLNRDGKWQDEWVLTNIPVYTSPGTNMIAVLGPFELQSPNPPMYT